MQIHIDMRCRKHVLCDLENLDISQSQMNMSANTAGQLPGYLKKRFRKQAGVTSQQRDCLHAARWPLLWSLSFLSSRTVCEPSAAH